MAAHEICSPQGLDDHETKGGVRVATDKRDRGRGHFACSHGTRRSRKPDPINVGGCLCGVRAHPPQVTFGVDGSVDLAGYVTGYRGYESPRGRLHWTTWGNASGSGWGGFWVDNDTPSVGGGTMTSYKVSVRVYRPRAGIFTRMTVTNQSGHRLGPYGERLTLHAVDQGGWLWEE